MKTLKALTIAITISGSLGAYAAPTGDWVDASRNKKSSARAKTQRLPIDMIAKDFDILVQEKQLQMNREEIEYKDPLEAFEANNDGLNDDSLLDDIKL